MSSSHRHHHHRPPHGSFALVVAIAAIALFVLLALRVVLPESAAAKVLVGQSAALTEHVSGMPASPDPGRRLQRADVQVEVQGWGTDEVNAYVEANVSLQGDPAGHYDADAALVVGFGTFSGKTCQVRNVISDETAGYTGRDYELVEYFEGLTGKWDCVAVILDNGIGGAPTTTYDAMVARLKDDFQAPKPKIKAVELLDKKQKRLKLVGGTWTRITVDVENLGSVDAGSLEVSGSGRKLKVKGGRADELEAERTETVDLRIKPKARRGKSKLKIVANAGGEKVKRSLKVKMVRPPKRPVDGTYESKDGRVDFRIEKGKVVGWRGFMQTRCGSYPDFPTYTMNYYDFPAVRVGRNGIVDAKSGKKDLYSAYLQLRAVGKKVTLGGFKYYGPGGCYAWIDFAAKRKGA